jgi:hypothetical protein
MKDIWKQVVAGLIVLLIAAAFGFLLHHLISSSPKHLAAGNRNTPSEYPSTVPATGSTSPTAAPRDRTTIRCAITPSGVAEIYSSPSFTAAHTSVPVASYPVIKREQVAFGGASAEWYKIKVQGQIGYIPDEPGQISANSCPPL